MAADYSQALDFLFQLQHHGIRLGLETVSELLRRMGHPHTHYPSLHIGGTNGKGSTAAMVAAIAHAAGYRVGLYTSPHLLDYRERIRVNGAPIQECDVSTLTTDLQAQLGDDLQPTFFEFTTAMAMAHFSRMAVDLAVFEVGLGGRFDATNVVTPLAAAITTIGLDHEDLLGSTISAIAYEKAGIVKPERPVVVGRLPLDAMQVIEPIALERSSPLSVLGRDFETTGTSTTDFGYRGRHTRLDHLSCPLTGRFQLDNAACALALIEASGRNGFRIDETAIRQGFAAVRWEGRLDTVCSSPQIVVDGAHNPAAAHALAEYLAGIKAEHPTRRVLLLVGMMRDKNREAFLQTLLPQVDEIFITQAHVPRASSPEELLACLTRIGGTGRCFDTPAAALAETRRVARPDDLILVTGSLMLVGEMTALLTDRPVSPIRG